MEIRRGSVWWWECPKHNRTHIQKGNRPVVVVSNDYGNAFSGVITVVPFTTSVKKPYPQQVPVLFDDGVSIALTDQITSIPVQELHRYICDLNTYQMDMIGTALAVQLGFMDVSDRPYASFLRRD